MSSCRLARISLILATNFVSTSPVTILVISTFTTKEHPNPTTAVLHNSTRRLWLTTALQHSVQIKEFKPAGTDLKDNQAQRTFGLSGQLQRSRNSNWLRLRHSRVKEC